MGVFFLFVSGLTFVNFTDNMLNASVLGKAMATKHCPSYRKIAKAWNDTLMVSPVFAHLPGFTGFTGFCQLGHVLLSAIPTEKGVTYAVATGEHQKFHYQTLINRFNDHGQVVMTLAQSARMGRL